MPKTQFINTNFTGGVFSPRLRGRVDLEKYNSSLREASNAVVLKHGGVTARPSLDYLGAIKDQTNTARSIGFVYSNDVSYVLEFGSTMIRFWKNGTLIESGGSPYEIANPYSVAETAEFDFVQSGDTMIMAHPSHPLKRLRRFGDAAWAVDDAPLNPGPIIETGARDNIVLTLSAATVGAGRTVTAASAFFMPADVGRALTCLGGLAKITAYTDSTHVTADITAAFVSTTLAGNTWALDGSPLTTATASAKDPVGTTITVTLGVDGFRNANQGSYIEINGGLVKIDSLSSATIANCIILRELTSTTATPADAWVLKSAVWNAIDGYPSCVNLFEQRLWGGSTTRYPTSMWGSRSGLVWDFTPGPNDDDAVYKTVDSARSNPIRYMHSGVRSMATLTGADEFDIRGGVEKAITQSNFSAKKQSKWGAAAVKPEEVGDNVIFVQRGGKVLRSVYALDVEGFAAKDIGVFSEHLMAEGIAGLTFQQTPESVLWCWLGDGTFIACTYSSEQNVVALVPGSTDGVIESMCTVPEGDADRTYVIVRRTINGATKRYMERFNWDVNPGLDSRVEATGSGVTWSGFDHLEGKTITVLADGITRPPVTVSGGAITLDLAASAVVGGLSYVPSITLQDAETSTGTGTSQGQSTSVHKVVVRFLKTVGCSVKAGDGSDPNVTVAQAIRFETFGDDPLDGVLRFFTGDKDISEYGWTTDGNTPITIYQPQPYPWTVLAVIRELTVNPG